MVEHVGQGTLGYDNTEQVFKFGQLVWDPIGLTWVRMTQPGGGGGGAGDASAANQALEIAALGAQADAEAAGNGSIIAILKRLRTLLSGTLTTDPGDRDARVLGRAKIWDGTDTLLITAAGAAVVDGSGVVQPISAAALPLPAGAATEVTLATRVAASQLPAALVGGRLDVNVGAALPAGTNNIGDVDVLTMPAIIGGKTNDNAAPGATNIGALIAIANEALAAYTEGNLVLPRADLRGVLRVFQVPMANLGLYELTFNTGVYNGLAANTPLWSMRWGDATRFAMLLRFELAVVTSTAATTAGVTERQLIIARSFSVSDTGGTAATITGNNQKRRTSMGTSLLTDMRWGAPITAGTRTLDAHASATALGWSGLLSTGFAIGASGASAVGAARSTEGGVQMHPFYNALNGQDYPVTFAQNEGAVMRIGRAQPAAAVQETFGRVLWLEANKIF